MKRKFICHVLIVLMMLVVFNLFYIEAESIEDEIVTTQIIEKATGESERLTEIITEEETITEEVATEKVTTEKIPTEETTKEILTEEITTKVVKNIYKVEFDYNGGKKAGYKLNVKKGETYGRLPNARRRYYQFVGWYTQKNGGNKITDNTIVSLSANHTLYAHWRKVRVSKKIKVKNIRQRKGKISIKVSNAKYASGYIIYCSYNKKFKKAKKLDISGRKRIKKYTFSVRKVLAKAKKGWTYYYRIRPYVIDSAGKKVWGKYGKVYSILYRKK